MRIIARRTLREFVAARSGHKDEPALKAKVEEALGVYQEYVKTTQESDTTDKAKPAEEKA